MVPGKIWTWASTMGGIPPGTSAPSRSLNDGILGLSTIASSSPPQGGLKAARGPVSSGCTASVGMAFTESISSLAISCNVHIRMRHRRRERGNQCHGSSRVLIYLAVKARAAGATEKLNFHPIERQWSCIKAEDCNRCSTFRRHPPQHKKRKSIKTQGLFLRLILLACRLFFSTSMGKTSIRPATRPRM